MLQRALAAYELALWIDCDATIVRFDSDPQSELPQDRFLALAPHEWTTAPNCGVWLMRSGPESQSFLAEVWASEQYAHRENMWEQGGVWDLLGYSTERLGEDGGSTRWRSGLAQLPKQWNWTSVDHHDREYVRHYAGLPFNERIWLMKADRHAAEGHLAAAWLRRRLYRYRNAATSRIKR